jgi:hypothetical protein
VIEKYGVLTHMLCDLQALMGDAAVCTRDIHMFIYKYVYVNIHMFTYLHVFIYISIHVYTYINLRNVYIWIRRYIYIYMFNI